MIAIENPQPNDLEQKYRQWYLQPNTRRLLDELLDEDRITPVSHPKVLICCAGDGGEGITFNSRGWTDISYIDKRRPIEPQAPGNWIYLDLYTLGMYLITDNPIEEKSVRKLQGKFDIVTSIAGRLGPQHTSLVVDYFAKPETGYTYVEE